jgi:hypothetical protein
LKQKFTPENSREKLKLLRRPMLSISLQAGETPAVFNDRYRAQVAEVP